MMTEANMSSAASSSPLSPGPPVSPPADYAPSPNTSSLALTRANQLRIQSLLRLLLAKSNDPSDDDENDHIDTLRVLRKTLRELDYNLSWLTQVDFLETLEHILVTYDETSRDISADHFRDEQRRERRRRAKDSGNVDDTGADDGDDEQQRSKHQDPQASSSSSWRLIHDATQLLLEALPLLRHEIGPELIDSIVPIAVENLGHQRSEVRRASLLLLNTMMRQMSAHFDAILRLFIDYGPANYRNQQARRGAILSLPLLMSQPIVERENLLPLVHCLSGLLVDDSNNSNEQLFYSLYLALQRLHMMMGDAKFVSLMSQCKPEAMQLYRQAASRHNSLAGSAAGGSGSGSFEGKTAQVPAGGAKSPAVCSSPSSSTSSSSSSPPSPEQQQQQQQQQPHRRRVSSINSRQPQGPPPVDGGNQQQQAGAAARSQQHVTFENDSKMSSTAGRPEGQSGADGDANQSLEAATTGQDDPMQSRHFRRSQSDDSLSPSDSSSSSQSTIGKSQSRRNDGESKNMTRREFSSDVSSTCSSDAHLVNPAHYMTKAALRGNPLDNYEQIHHIDHSQVDSLAINDFGPICNTPTMEVAPKLNYLTKIRFTNSGALSPTSGAGQHQSGPTSGAGALILRDDSLTRSELKFGILPRQLINISLNASLRSADRYEAMQELMCIVRESPVNHLAILMTYFDSFLEQFISKLIVSSSSGASGASSAGTPLHAANASRSQQANSGANMVQQQTSLKLSLIAIDMLETIVIKTKVSTMQYIRPIVGLLLKALGSQQASADTGPLSPAASLMRENVCRVIHKMMAYLPPQHVIDAIFEHKHSRSSLVREESINRVTAACLEYDRNEFNLTKLCYHVLPMLADHEQNVRMAALECIATLAHILGPGRIGSLLTAAEAVQTNCDYDGLLGAINARLQRHALPRCHSNGMIKYVIKPFLFGASQLLAADGSTGAAGAAAAAASSTAPSDEQQQRQLSVAADIRWVLEAPSSHQHSSGPYYHPHSHSHAHIQSTLSPLDIATGHVSNYIASAGLADQAEAQHHHHRLGVYSPPSMAERRRRSSVGVIGLHQLADLEAKQLAAGSGSTQHLHEHHHAMHHSMSSEEQQDGRAGDDEANANAATGQQQQAGAQRRSKARDSSRGENASGRDASVVESRRRPSGPRPSRQSISTSQSQPDQVKASSKVTTATNDTSESKAADRRDQLLSGESNVDAGASGSCPRRASTKLGPGGEYNGSGSGSDGCCSSHQEAAARSERVKSYSLPQQQDQQGPKTNLMRQQRLSCDQCSGASNQVRTNEAEDSAKCQHSGSFEGKPNGRQDGQQQQQQSSRSRQRKSSNNNNNISSGSNFGIQRLPRSNSQDSVSSTDTMLPSDSIIIYSDINQAHAQSRQQSRYQQTSFELPTLDKNDPDRNYQSPAGGRIVPTTPSSPIPTISKSSQQASGSHSDQQDKEGSSSGRREMQSPARQQQQRRQSQQRLTRSSSNTLRRQMSVATDERLAGDGDHLVRDQHEQESPISASGGAPHLVQQQRRIDDASDVKNVDRRMSMAASGNSRRKQSTGDKQQQQEFQAAEDEPERRNERSFSSGGSQSQGSGRPGSELGGQVEGRRKSLHGSKNRSREDNSGELTDERPIPNSNYSNDGGSNRDNRTGPLQRNESGTTAPSISTIEYNQAGAAPIVNTLDDHQDRRSSGEHFEYQEASGACNHRRQSSSIDLDGHEQQSDDNELDERQVSAGRQNRMHRSEVRNLTKMAATGTRTGDGETVAAASLRRRASRSQPPSAGSRHHQPGGRDSRSPTIDRSAGSHDSESAGARDGQHQEMLHKRAGQQQQQVHYLKRQPNQNQHVQQQLKPATSVRRSVSVSPSLSNSVNIRHILENVAQIEGNFVDPQLAYKVAMDALDSPCWSTKVEGILALIRLVAHHPQFVLGQSAHNSSGRLHEMVLKLTNEIGNLRSTVARSAIFALGDFCAKLRRSIEPEMDLICKALMQKSNENTAFIRDDIRRALDEMVNSLTPWRLANSLIVHGAQHKSANVRRMASQFVAQLVVDRLGAAKCLVGSREISSILLPAASKFAQDNSPHTRYYGRLILSKLMSHNSFDRLLRRNLTSTLYRSTVGIIESIKRRGPGELPQGD